MKVKIVDNFPIDSLIVNDVFYFNRQTKIGTIYRNGVQEIYPAVLPNMGDPGSRFQDSDLDGIPDIRESSQADLKDTGWSSGNYIKLSYTHSDGTTYPETQISLSPLSDPQSVLINNSQTSISFIAELDGAIIRVNNDWDNFTKGQLITINEGDSLVYDIFVDTDGDGTPDSQDDFPNDPNEDTDNDGDGVGANTDIDDNDPKRSSGTDTDGDGTDDEFDLIPDDGPLADADGDGIINSQDDFPDDATNTKYDQQLVWNEYSAGMLLSNSPIYLSATTDSGETISYSVTSGPGSINGNALTLNSAGTITVEAFAPGNNTYNSRTISRNFNIIDDVTDTDGDGTPDYSDSDNTDGPLGDSDGDGTPNNQDSDNTDGPLGDSDGDGTPNNQDNDNTDGPLGDSDGDGTPNNQDNDNTDGPLGDIDGDGIPNNQDNDDTDGPLGDADGDGTPNNQDSDFVPPATASWLGIEPVQLSGSSVPAYNQVYKHVGGRLSAWDWPLVEGVSSTPFNGTRGYGANSAPEGDWPVYEGVTDSSIKLAFNGSHWAVGRERASNQNPWGNDTPASNNSNDPIERRTANLSVDGYLRGPNGLGEHNPQDAAPGNNWIRYSSDNNLIANESASLTITALDTNGDGNYQNPISQPYSSNPDFYSFRTTVTDVGQFGSGNSNSQSNLQQAVKANDIVYNWSSWTGSDESNPISAFDGDTTSVGTSGGWFCYVPPASGRRNYGWIGIDLNLNSSLGDGYQTVNQYQIWPDAQSVAELRTVDPKDWTFEGSIDGTNWTVLDTQTNQSFTSTEITDNSNPVSPQQHFIGNMKEYNFINTTPYRYYRLNVSANNGHPSFLAIQELKFNTFG